MKIYYESVFFLNFLLDFMILYGTKRLLKISKKNIRLILGAMVGSLTTFLLLFKISNNLLFILKIILSVAIILISFGFNNFFKNIFYFYVISIILGGCFYLFDLPDNYFLRSLFLLVGSSIFIFFFLREEMQYKEKIANRYVVRIHYQKKWYDLEGFIDTGNQLLSPLKKESVILVNLSLPLNNVIYVPYKTLNTHGVVPCVRPDKVIINNKEFSHCLIGLAKEKISSAGCNCVLPNCFKEELC